MSFDIPLIQRLWNQLLRIESRSIRVILAIDSLESNLRKFITNFMQVLDEGGEDLMRLKRVLIKLGIPGFKDRAFSLLNDPVLIAARIEEVLGPFLEGAYEHYLEKEISGFEHDLIKDLLYELIPPDLRQVTSYGQLVLVSDQAKPNLPRGS